MQNDIRWKQRFYNYQKAIVQLTKFIEKGELSELEEQGIIVTVQGVIRISETDFSKELHPIKVQKISVEKSRILVKPNAFSELETLQVVFPKI